MIPDTRESLIEELRAIFFNEAEENAAQGGVERPQEDDPYFLEEATDFVDRCIAFGKTQ